MRRGLSKAVADGLWYGTTAGSGTGEGLQGPSNNAVIRQGAGAALSSDSEPPTVDGQDGAVDHPGAG
jgi:hypothetical protein